MKRENNRIEEDKPVVATNSSIVLEYATLESQNGQVSKVANYTSAVCQQHSSNKTPALNQPARNNMVNVQLAYDINQALNPESWDSDF